MRPCGAAHRYPGASLHLIAAIDRAKFLGVDAAFGDGARPMAGGDDRWNLPRFVCGRDWSSPREFESLLATT